jgi:hypothetical protein
MNIITPVDPTEKEIVMGLITISDLLTKTLREQGRELSTVQLDALHKAGQVTAYLQKHYIALVAQRSADI